MHTLNLFPRGHLVRMALLALLLTLATMALIAAVRPVELGSGGSSAAPETTPPQDVRPAPSQPAWVENPLAPPTLRLER